MPAKKTAAAPAAADLSDLLGQATEEMNIPPATDFEPVVIAAPTAEAAPDDFTDEPEPEFFATEEVTDEPAPAPTPADAKKSARRLIDFVDNLQKPLLVNAYKSTVLLDGDYEKVQEYHKQREARGKFSFQEAITEDDAFYDVSKRFEEYMELVKAAPFTDDEKDSLSGPLAEVLEKHTAFQLTPEVALLLAVAMVMLPRVAPLIPMFKKGFTL